MLFLATENKTKTGIINSCSPCQGFFERPNVELSRELEVEGLMKIRKQDQIHLGLHVAQCFEFSDWERFLLHVVIHPLRFFRYPNKCTIESVGIRTA